MLGESQPFVSIVTPFYNTENYLSECIESVLAQTYGNWEYLLVDNCSTDRSRQIAEEYACRCDRVRLLENSSFLKQLGNYNQALARVSDKADFVKIVQADDWIFPECIERMVELALKHPRIGIVSSYYLAGNDVSNVGLPFPSENKSGRELCRRQLKEREFYFGSPTTVLYRAEIVRNRPEFYREDRLHADTEACYEILESWDFGFVHQILSYTRIDEESTWGKHKQMEGYLDALICLRRFGPIYLSPSEYEAAASRVETDYWYFLGRNLLKGRGKGFWAFHKQGLAMVGARLPYVRLLGYAVLGIIDDLLNPKRTFEKLFYRG
jgi:glycosyltransferase involved in cell wall biosynthesis